MFTHEEKQKNRTATVRCARWAVARCTPLPGNLLYINSHVIHASTE